MAAAASSNVLLAPRKLCIGDTVLRETPLILGRRDQESSPAVEALATTSRLSKSMCSFYRAVLLASAETRAAVLALPVPSPLDAGVNIEFAVACRRLGSSDAQFDAKLFTRAATLHRFCAFPVNAIVDADTGATKDDGCAVYDLHSRATHSCLPNCFSMDVPGQNIIVSGDRFIRALEDIAEGAPRVESLVQALSHHHGFLSRGAADPCTRGRGPSSLRREAVPAPADAGPH